MSINQYSSDINPETPWWRQQSRLMMEPLIQNASSSCGPAIHPSWATQGQLQQAPRVVNRGFNLNNQQDEEELLEEEEEEEEEVEVEVEVEEEENGRSRGRSGEEKEAMFEKALTPSDVGKLNRLVIPKQQAEKYFPLSDSGENKGVVLSFEDESCKCWRFRYSYWNSSQSYVLTKGWSRYVKDKRLLAGDVVCFLRLSSRLFISFRRRHTHDPNPTVGLPWTTTTTPFYSHSYPTHHQPFPFPPQPPPPGRGRQSHQKQSCNKVLRLFGVNMECQTPPETQDKQEEAGESTPQYPTTTHHMTSSSTYHNLYHYHHPSYAHHHMDVNQMRNRPG